MKKIAESIDFTAFLLAFSCKIWYNKSIKRQEKPTP